MIYCKKLLNDKLFYFLWNTYSRCTYKRYNKRFAYLSLLTFYHQCFQEWLHEKL